MMLDLNWEPDNECPAKWEETASAVSVCDVEVASKSGGWIHKL